MNRRRCGGRGGGGRGRRSLNSEGVIGIGIETSPSSGRGKRIGDDILNLELIMYWNNGFVLLSPSLAIVKDVKFKKQK
ncbi:unnamed protein product [Cochlearia groenlandica]